MLQSTKSCDWFIFWYKYEVFKCFNVPKHIMRPLTLAQHTCIITLLDAGTSGHQIHNLTGLGIGTISRLCSQYCSELAKSSGGHPSKLTPANIGYAKQICLHGQG